MRLAAAKAGSGGAKRGETRPAARGRPDSFKAPMVRACGVCRAGSPPYTTAHVNSATQMARPQPGGAHALAHRYAEIRSDLERRGCVIGGNDLWIAAHAAIRGMTVVTGNTSEFQRVAGLVVEDWTV